ncbi:MAG: hypothetical protein KDI19_15940 [Pseudomonadales bacterium]|nr:hypothetical protein [Pseudomonadales bacterium]
MTNWFDALTGLEQFLVLTGVFSTLVFLIQFALGLVGIAGDDLDLDADADGGDGALDFSDIFTIRNGVAFLMGFSWGGLMVHDWGISNAFLIAVVGFFVGSTLVGVNLLLLFGLSRLKDAGNIRLENAIDEVGRVTLHVPASRSGVGKVMVTVQGRLKEYHAVTDGEELPRNAPALVLDVNGSQLVVSKYINR